MERKQQELHNQQARSVELPHITLSPHTMRVMETNERLINELQKRKKQRGLFRLFNRC